MEAGDIVGGKYKLVKKLGAGSFGHIYSAIHLENQREFAIKIEYPTAKRPQLLSEARILKQLQSAQGIPAFYWVCSEPNYNAMVLELLGPSLHAMMQRFSKSLSIVTVVKVGDQLVKRIEYIHGKNFLHRDIKPDNFCIGLRKAKSIVYAVDFGLSKKYRDPKSHQHIPYKENKSLTGTARFASINSHMGLELSRRDDLESVSYVMIYMATGELPWQGIHATTKQDKYRRIMDKKNAVTPEILCRNLPGEFCFLLKYARSLRFEERPDYEYCTRLLQNIARRDNYDLLGELEWRPQSTPVQSKRSQSVKQKRRKRVKSTRPLSVSPQPPSPQPSAEELDGTENCTRMPEILDRDKIAVFRTEIAIEQEKAGCALM
mmetsp:Transcript_10644/g.20611  ORF Transcript_10644/g.20611 Transcript_10644/m.20611 type:complete len:375 (+) Transcript_10644:3421-4545(+)